MNFRTFLIYFISTTIWEFLDLQFDLLECSRVFWTSISFDREIGLASIRPLILRQIDRSYGQRFFNWWIPERNLLMLLISTILRSKNEELSKCTMIIMTRPVFKLWAKTECSNQRFLRFVSVILQMKSLDYWQTDCLRR